MRCHQCGSTMREMTTDLPFKVTETTIVIVRDLPVRQCENCREYILSDPVMERVDKILENIDGTTELEVIRYAA